MKASKVFLKTADVMIRAAVIFFLVIAGLYSGYALWDNAQIYAAVDDVQSELLKLNQILRKMGVLLLRNCVRSIRMCVHG